MDLHVLAEISAVRGVAQQKQVFVAYQGDGTVGTPSRQFVMNNENREYEVKTVNVATYVDWKDGVLNFDGMPLEELGDKLGRWYEVKFFFTKESLKRLKFSGAFKKYNEIGYILSLIEATTDVTFKINKDVIVVNEK